MKTSRDAQGDKLELHELSGELEKRPKRRKLRRVAKTSALAACFLAIGTTGVGTWKLRSSLPVITGVHRTQHLVDPIQVERDAMGIPTIESKSRVDAAYGLGYVHGQDRFFQMDLLRRMTAGRLSELVGKGAVGTDKRYRKHRFTQMAETIYGSLAIEQKELVDAYARGVNEGLHRLEDEPFEYQVLQLLPEDWEPKDSFLVMLTMLCDLQPMDGTPELALTELHEKVPPEVFAYLVRAGSRWDAAIDGSEVAMPGIPSEEVWSMRVGKERQGREEAVAAYGGGVRSPELFWGSWSEDLPSEFRVGSNNWAVSSKVGRSSADISASAVSAVDTAEGRPGRAILASDMHLGLNVPTIWYRAVMRTPTADGKDRQLVGVTLPGTPVLIEGSNGSVAWGFTNSYGDYGDLIELKMVNEREYATPTGPKELETFTETFVF